MNILESLHGRGRLDPGSRTMDIGLADCTPIEALDELRREPQSMSVALHEITHFESLQNPLGQVLGYLGLLGSAHAEQIEAWCKRRDADAPTEMDALVEGYIYLQHEYTMRLELWRPLLEGLALYVQTAPPCDQLDEIVQPLHTLTFLAANVGMLSPATRDPTGRDLLQVGYETMADGASLPVGLSTLAASIEFETGDEWLPYFLGHAYVRALNQRLVMASDQYECPEMFVRVMLRLLNGSTRRLLEPDVRWDSPTAVERVYSWIDILQRAPVPRLREIESLPPETDLLRFIETGEVAAGYHGGSEAVAGVLAVLVPGAWRMLASSLKQRGMDPGQVAAGWIAAASSLNISSGGDCACLGWIPQGGHHAVAVSVNGDVWWLRVPDAQLNSMPYGLEELPQLAPSNIEEGSATRSNDLGPLPLKVNCFVSSVGYGLPRPANLGPSDLNTACLFEFVHPTESSRRLLTALGSGNSRAYLDAAPPETTAMLHAGGERMRETVEGYAGFTLEKCGLALRQAGSEAAAERASVAFKSQEDAVSRQRDLWVHRITVSLLGANTLGRRRQSLRSRRMNAALPSRDDLLTKFLSAAYGSPRRLSKEPARMLASIAAWNRQAKEGLGREVFEVDEARKVARYVGIWGRSREGA